MKRRRVLTGTVGVLVLSVGLVLANYGGGVTPAGAQAAPPNPSTVIIDKLNQILAALTGAAGQNNHTLRWDRNHPSASRFTTAFPGAVLDKNTGLVWEQAPDATLRDWGNNTPASANHYCANKPVGGTKGWRLPSVAELASLVDPANFNPALPTGHPFTNVQFTTGQGLLLYWAATLDGEGPGRAWGVGFKGGNVDSHTRTNTDSPAWCVRGPMQESVY